MSRLICLALTPPAAALGTFGTQAPKHPRHLEAPKAPQAPEARSLGAPVLLQDGLLTYPAPTA